MTKVRRHVTLDKELDDRITDYCYESGMSRSKFHSRAAQKYLGDVMTVPLIGMLGDDTDWEAIKRRLEQLKGESDES